MGFLPDIRQSSHDLYTQQFVSDPYITDGARVKVNARSAALFLQFMILLTPLLIKIILLNQ